MKKIYIILTIINDITYDITYQISNNNKKKSELQQTPAPGDINDGIDYLCKLLGYFSQRDKKRYSR